MALMFGSEEGVDCIVDVDLEGPAGQALCLAHKHTKTFFGAGVWVSDDGYVLGVKGEDLFFDMPTGRELKDLQAEALLPKPLPDYSISTWDYAFGYSLWIILGAMALFYGARMLLRLKGSRPSGTTTS